MAAGLKMSTSVGADLARENPFLGALAVFELLAVGFLDLVGWQTHAQLILLVKYRDKCRRRKHTMMKSSQAASHCGEKCVCKMINQRIL